MAFIENLKVETVKHNGITLTWNWSDTVSSLLDLTNVTTVIKLFYPNDVLMKIIKPADPKSTKYLFNQITDSSLKICLNISISQEGPSKSSIYKSSSETCIQHNADNWSSVPVSLGSSLAGFVVLLLIVCLIFFTQKLGKKRRVMSKTCSTKRNKKDSYMYLYPILNDADVEQSNAIYIEKQERKISVGNTIDCELNTSKVDLDSVKDIESLDSATKTDSLTNVNKGKYDIIKCDCGFIHLVGTEVECDDFLQKPVIYGPHVPLAHQDTVSIDSNPSI